VALLLGLLSFVAGCDDDPKKTTPTDDVVDDTAADTVTDVTTTDTTVTDTEDTNTPDTTGDTEEDSLADTPDVEPDVTPECTSACDCEQGDDCVSGLCELGAEAVLCCENAGCTDGKSCTSADGSAGLCGVATSPSFGAILFNEVLSDGAVSGDPNGDGDFPDPTGDEFVELVNVSSSSVNLDGFTLVESHLAVLPRHTFATGDALSAGEALAIFGGGTAPDNISGATYLVANAADPGVSMGLHLNNDGDVVRLLDGDGLLVAIFAYGPGAELPAVTDQSYTRNPDLTGAFVPHTNVTSVDGPFFSPGTRADGTNF